MSEYEDDYEDGFEDMGEDYNETNQSADAKQPSQPSDMPAATSTTASAEQPLTETKSVQRPASSTGKSQNTVTIVPKDDDSAASTSDEEEVDPWEKETTTAAIKISARGSQQLENQVDQKQKTSETENDPINGNREPQKRVVAQDISDDEDDERDPWDNEEPVDRNSAGESKHSNTGAVEEQEGHPQKNPTPTKVNADEHKAGATKRKSKKKTAKVKMHVAFGKHVPVQYSDSNTETDDEDPSMKKGRKKKGGKNVKKKKKKKVKQSDWDKPVVVDLDNIQKVPKARRLDVLTDTTKRRIDKYLTERKEKELKKPPPEAPAPYETESKWLDLAEIRRPEVDLENEEGLDFLNINLTDRTVEEKHQDDVSALLNELKQKEAKHKPKDLFLFELEAEALEEEVVIGAVPVQDAMQREAKLETERVDDLLAKRTAQKKLIGTVTDRASGSIEALNNRLGSNLSQIDDVQKTLRKTHYSKLDDMEEKYNRVREILVRRVKLHRRAVEKYFGQLDASGSLSYVPEKSCWNSLFRPNWFHVPTICRIRINSLRAVKNKLPSGRYFIMATLMDRIAGHPLQKLYYEVGQGPLAQRIVYFGTTQPVMHHGTYHQIQMKWSEEGSHIFVACPSDNDLQPAMCILFELILGRTARTGRDIVMGWGVFPLCTEHIKIATGRFKVPLLRGAVDRTVTKYQDVEDTIKNDIDNWLCNLYFDVRPKSRTHGKVNERVEINQRTDSLLHLLKREDEQGDNSEMSDSDFSDEIQARGDELEMQELGEPNAAENHDPQAEDVVIMEGGEPSSSLNNSQSGISGGMGGGEDGVSTPLLQRKKTSSFARSETKKSFADALRAPTTRDFGRFSQLNVNRRLRERKSKRSISRSNNHFGSTLSIARAPSSASQGRFATRNRSNFARSDNTRRNTRRSMTIMRRSKSHNTDPMQKNDVPGSQEGRDSKHSKGAATDEKNNTSNNKRGLDTKIIHPQEDGNRDAKKNNNSKVGGKISLFGSLREKEIERNENDGVDDEEREAAEIDKELDRLSRRNKKDLAAYNFAIVNSEAHTPSVHEILKRLKFLFGWLYSDISSNRFGTLEFWTLILLFFLGFYLRMFVHFMGEYYFLVSMDRHPYEFICYPWTCYIRYNQSESVLGVEIAMTLVGQLWNFLGFAAGCFVFAILQLIQIPISDFMSRIMLVYGILCILDPVFILIGDIVVLYKYGDYFKLFYYFQYVEPDVGGGAGAMLTLLLVTVGTISMIALLAFYLMFLHMGGRTLDIYNRTHQDESSFFLPHDMEISTATLRYLLLKARTFRSFEGNLRRIYVTSYIERDHQFMDFERRSTHIALFTWNPLNPKRVGDIYRQFLWRPDGSILEVFKEASDDQFDVLMRHVKAMHQEQQFHDEEEGIDDDDGDDDDVVAGSVRDGISLLADNKEDGGSFLGRHDNLDSDFKFHKPRNEGASSIHDEKSGLLS